ncbi:hypothetical protein YK56LOC_37860 [Caballeronia sp. HLA56]
MQADSRVTGGEGARTSAEVNAPSRDYQRHRRNVSYRASQVVLGAVSEHGSAHKSVVTRISFRRTLCFSQSARQLTADEAADDAGG